MPKKSKRQVRKTSSSPRVDSTSVISSSTRTFEREFNPDYTHVLNDLRRIAMLAGSFFVLLVILAFILR